MQSGADDFLTKPCREDDVIEKIGALLNIAYEYEDLSDAEYQPLTGLGALSTAIQGQLPQALAKELLDATLSGNKRRLDQLIEALRGTDKTATANALQELADRYEYDTLQRLLEEAGER